MNSKITVPIAIVISVIVTAGIMYSINFEQPIETTVITQPTEITHIEKPTSEFLKGTNDIKKISSHEELKNIIEASSIVGGIYDDRIFSMNTRIDGEVMFDMAESSGPVALQSSSKIIFRGFEFFNYQCSS